MQFRAREENFIAYTFVYGGDVDKKIEGFKSRLTQNNLMHWIAKQQKKNRLYKDGTIVIEDQLQL